MTSLLFKSARLFDGLRVFAEEIFEIRLRRFRPQDFTNQVVYGAVGHKESPAE